MKHTFMAVLLAAAAITLSACGNADSSTVNTSTGTESSSDSVSSSLEPGQVARQETSGGSYTTQEIDVDNNGQNIYGKVYLPSDYTDGDKVPLVIFSHELGNDHTSGTPYAEQLAQNGYAAYVFDFRGGSVSKNQSDGESTSMSVRTEESDLEAVIEAAQTWDFTDTDNIVLMGGSQGGMVTALTAADHPDAAKAVILMYPALSIVDDTHSQFASEDDVPETYGLFGGWMTVGRNYSTDVWDLDVYGTIAQYTGPVLILHGDYDSTVDISYSERAANAYQNDEFHVIEGAGHGFSGNHFDQAVDYILDFLQRNVTAGTGMQSEEATESQSEDLQEGTAITVTIDGTNYDAYLNDSAAAEDLISQLPLTLTYRAMGSGFEEKIADLSGELDLSDGGYEHDPVPGDIAYWSPQPRIVLYYGDVGSWDGINVIGHFDDEEQAEQAVEAMPDGTEVTIAEKGVR